MNERTIIFPNSMTSCLDNEDESITIPDEINDKRRGVSRLEYMLEDCNASCGEAFWAPVLNDYACPIDPGCGGNNGGSPACDSKWTCSKAKVSFAENPETVWIPPPPPDTEEEPTITKAPPPPPPDEFPEMPGRQDSSASSSVFTDLEETEIAQTGLEQELEERTKTKEQPMAELFTRCGVVQYASTKEKQEDLIQKVRARKGRSPIDAVQEEKKSEVAEDHEEAERTAPFSLARAISRSFSRSPSRSPARNGNHLRIEGDLKSTSTEVLVAELEKRLEIESVNKLRYEKVDVEQQVSEETTKQREEEGEQKEESGEQLEGKEPQEQEPQEQQKRRQNAEDRPIWVKAKDPASGRNYYFHSLTRQTTWSNPTKSLFDSLTDQSPRAVVVRNDKLSSGSDPMDQEPITLRGGTEVEVEIALKEETSVDSTRASERSRQRPIKYRPAKNAVVEKSASSNSQKHEPPKPKGRHGKPDVGRKTKTGKQKASALRSLLKPFGRRNR